jgi:hypothetical protein
MSRSDRRIDRPLLPASCPVCGHVVLRADGVSREGATCWGQVSGNRCHYAAWAEPLRPFCRSLDGHGRWSLCRWTTTGRPAAPADSGCPTQVPHHRRASEFVPHNGHLQWLRWRGRVRRGVQQPGEWTGGRTHRRASYVLAQERLSHLRVGSCCQDLYRLVPWAYSSRRSVIPRSWVVVGALHQVERYPRRHLLGLAVVGLEASSPPRELCAVSTGIAYHRRVGPWCGPPAWEVT